MQSPGALNLKVVAVGTDFEKAVAIVADKAAIQRAHPLVLAGFHLAMLDLKRRTSRKDLTLRILGLRMSSVVGSLVSKMLMENRSGSFRTAKRAS